MSVRGFICSVAVALLALPTIASAQQNPVLENFRAYSAALEQGDLTAAERAAEAALAASEARDGDGGRTAILALNVATVRLLQNRGADALAPAQRALSLAQANPESGVDPLMAQLILGRAELADGSTLEEEQRLAAAIAQAEQRSDLAQETYSAALALGQAAFAARRYEASTEYWRSVSRLADAAPIAPDLARANAYTWEGASVLAAGTTQPVRRLSFNDARRALGPFIQAQALVQAAAFIELPDGALSGAQAAYAHMIAWRSTIVSRIGSPVTRRLFREEAARLQLTDRVSGEPDESSDVCPMRIERPEITYPEEELRDYQIATVVVRLRLNEGGAITAGRVAAYVGSRAFSDTIRDSIPRWQAHRAEGAREGCRAPTMLFVPVSFVIAQYR